MTLDMLIAREAIRYTLSVYNNAADRGQIEEVLSTFVEGGVLETSISTLAGRADMQRFFTSVRDATHGGQSLLGSRHNLTTCRIEVDDADHARAWTYFMVVREGTILQSGLYIDRLVRQGHRWLLEHRRVKLDFDR